MRTPISFESASVVKTEHFIIVGGQRCGTTGVYHLLDQHPDICLAAPVRPEPKFFLDGNAINVGYPEYLRRHFSHRRDERILGEKSTSYIEREDAIPRIHQMLPDARLIFVLRDPIMRAYSNWRFSTANGIETLDFESALDAEKERSNTSENSSISVSPFAYAARGHYVHYLDRWARYFDPDRFIIVVSETIFADPSRIRDVHQKLGVNQGNAVTDIGRVNASPGEHGQLPIGAQNRLRGEFAESTSELKERWHVDVSTWL